MIYLQHLSYLAKRMKRESITDHYYQEQPISKSDSFIRSLPASEPIYEHISDCHDQPQSKPCVIEGEDKGGIRAFKSTSCTQFVHPAQTKEAVDVPPLPMCTERARHTPDGDYVEMKVFMEAQDGSRCGGFSIPCGRLRETL